MYVTALSLHQYLLSCGTREAELALRVQLLAGVATYETEKYYYSPPASCLSVEDVLCWAYRPVISLSPTTLPSLTLFGNKDRNTLREDRVLVNALFIILIRKCLWNKA